MARAIGTIRALRRYPVKSMAGEPVASAALGFHGLEGDRRLAFMREGDAGGFPWLTAGKLPEMLQYRPFREDGADPASLPTHVVTPRGETLELFGEALRRELSEAHGRPVRLVRLDRGVFDEATVSVITSETIAEIERRAERALDPRRFRPNLLLDAEAGAGFPEEGWVGKVLAFGDPDAGPAVGVTLRDVRCSMVNLDPDTGAVDPVVLKTVVRTNGNIAGVYGATLRAGEVSVGDRVFLVDL